MKSAFAWTKKPNPLNFMDVYLLRHGMAWEKGSPKYPRDSERPLTREGIREMKKVAKGLRKLDLDFDKILSSPYRRALETAQIVTKKLKLRKRLELFDGLASDVNPQRTIKVLVKHRHTWKSVLLVGHEPYLSHLIGKLVANDTTISLDFKKGGLAKLTLHPFIPSPHATLDWLIPPRILKHI